MKSASLLLALLIIIHSEIHAQTYARHDVLITEFFPDPQPSVSLPASEFIELTNCSGNSINLEGWSVSDLTSNTSIKTPVWVEPGQSVIICPASAANTYAVYGLTIGIAGFPSLNNDADQILLRDPQGSVIHAVDYTNEWYGNGLKIQGGWTLEMIDLQNPCGGKTNWTASMDPSGGSPGKSNSVKASNPDITSPMLVRSFMEDSLNMVLHFNEPLDSREINAAAINLSDDFSGRIISVSAITPLFKSVLVTLSEPVQNHRVYTISVTLIRDCAGNLIGSFNNTRTGIAGIPDPGQIILNEILFNPKSGGADYIELLHRGAAPVDLSALYLSKGQTGHITLAKEPFLIFPGDHTVFTTDLKNLAENYIIHFDGSAIEIDELPSFPDDRGKVILSDFQGRSIDELTYSEDWHSPLVKEPDGVALERIDPELPTEKKDNWTSASSLSGYGTPGYRNSQYKSSPDTEGELMAEPQVFSPDGDGWEDFTTIQYRVSSGVMSGSIIIYDASGRQVNAILPNGILGSSGRLNWHGVDSKRNKLPVGLYIISMRIFDSSGKTRKILRPVVIAK